MLEKEDVTLSKQKNNSNLVTYKYDYVCFILLFSLDKKKKSKKKQQLNVFLCMIKPKSAGIVQGMKGGKEWKGILWMLLRRKQSVLFASEWVMWKESFASRERM